MRNSTNFFPLRNLIVLGAGNVTESKIDPALASLAAEGKIDRVSYLDVRETCPFESKTAGAEYHTIDPVTPIAPQLVSRGIDASQCLSIVACPTRWHAGYARQFAQLGRTAVEKPLTMDAETAKELSAMPGDLHAIGHQLFKKPMLDFLDRCLQRVVPIPSVSRIEFDLLETISCGNRLVDPILWDTGMHAAEALLSTYEAAGVACRFELLSARCSRYRDDTTIATGEASTVRTAGRVDAMLHTPHGTVDVVFRLGKGMGRATKGLRLYAGDNQVEEVNLDESGSAAHRRLIDELLSQPTPNMRLSLPGVVQAIEWCDEANRVATNEPDYDFGTTPDWMTEERLHVRANSKLHRIWSVRPIVSRHLAKAAAAIAVLMRGF